MNKLKSIFRKTGSCRCHRNATDAVEPTSKSRTSDQNKFSIASAPIHGRNPIVDSRAPISVADGASLDHFSVGNFPDFPSPKICNSIAIVKDSDDPFLDFRRSMIQMIVENGIRSMKELRQLLECFLRLNSPEHHEIILRAFVEIWEEDVFSADSGGKGEGRDSIVINRVATRV